MMVNFEFNLPTKVIFGRGVLDKIGEECCGIGKRVLFVYGKESLKRSGLYDTIIGSLKGVGIAVVEHSGVSPNPTIEHTVAGVKRGRSENVDFVLAVGGGSVIDEAKGVAAGIPSEDPLWSYYTGEKSLKKALPVVAVQTLPATSSETNPVSVITNTETQEKFTVRTPLLTPKVAFLDPEVTLTIPIQYTAYACFDIMSHISEGYFNATDPFAVVQDGLAEGLLKAVMASLEKLLEDPRNYDARAAVMWAGALAWSGLVNAGLEGATIPCHMLEHPMSGMYDIAHGAGLAICTPVWLHHRMEKIAPRIRRFGENVLGMGEGAADCEAVIDKYARWIKSIGCPATFSEAGVSDPDISGLVEHAKKLSRLWGVSGYSDEDLCAIYKGCK